MAVSIPEINDRLFKAALAQRTVLLKEFSTVENWYLSYRDSSRGDVFSSVEQQAPPRINPGLPEDRQLTIKSILFGFKDPGVISFNFAEDIYGRALKILLDENRIPYKWVPSTFNSYCTIIIDCPIHTLDLDRFFKLIDNGITSAVKNQLLKDIYFQLVLGKDWRKISDIPTILKRGQKGNTIKEDFFQVAKAVSREKNAFYEMGLTLLTMAQQDVQTDVQAYQTFSEVDESNINYKNAQLELGKLALRFADKHDVKADKGQDQINNGYLLTALEHFLRAGDKAQHQIDELHIRLTGQSFPGADIYKKFTQAIQTIHQLQVSLQSLGAEGRAFNDIQKYVVSVPSHAASAMAFRSGEDGLLFDFSRHAATSSAASSQIVPCRAAQKPVTVASAVGQVVPDLGAQSKAVPERTHSLSSEGRSQEAPDSVGQNVPAESYYVVLATLGF